jgi:hypothetical protein
MRGAADSMTPGHHLGFGAVTAVQGEELAASIFSAASFACCGSGSDCVDRRYHLGQALPIKPRKVCRPPAFRWANTALGNIKAAVMGTYRAVNGKHVLRYNAEFELPASTDDRILRPSAMIPRLTWTAVRTTPMPFWSCGRGAEAYA